MQTCFNKVYDNAYIVLTGHDYSHFVYLYIYFYFLLNVFYLEDEEQVLEGGLTMIKRPQYDHLYSPPQVDEPELNNI